LVSSAVHKTALTLILFSRDHQMIH